METMNRQAIIERARELQKKHTEEVKPTEKQLTYIGSMEKELHLEECKREFKTRAEVTEYIGYLQELVKEFRQLLKDDKREQLLTQAVSLAIQYGHSEGDEYISFLFTLESKDLIQEINLTRESLEESKAYDQKFLYSEENKEYMRQQQRDNTWLNETRVKASAEYNGSQTDLSNYIAIMLDNEIDEELAIKIAFEIQSYVDSL